jgi:hypothetical protein
MFAAQPTEAMNSVQEITGAVVVSVPSSVTRASSFRWELPAGQEKDHRNMQQQTATIANGMQRLTLQALGAAKGAGVRARKFVY